jgi:hypothetical protein
MENSFNIKNDLELHEAFGIILSIQSFAEYINDIIELVYNGVLDNNNLEEVLKKYNVKKVEEIKEELLDVLIVYINLILQDHLITQKEINNVQFFKMIFKIKEGDFFKYRYDEIDEILNKQFIRIYRNDNKIDENESLHQVSLQKLFDLSYDQFLGFQEMEVLAAIERGGNIQELDTAYKSPKSTDSISDFMSRRISQKVKDLVWNRDNGKCVQCGSNLNLEFDHIIPFSKGGSNTYRNIQLLCENCNRKKSSKIG